MFFYCTIIRSKINLEPFLIILKTKYNFCSAIKLNQFYKLLSPVKDKIIVKLNFILFALSFGLRKVPNPYHHI